MGKPTLHRESARTAFAALSVFCLASAAPQLALSSPLQDPAPAVQAQPATAAGSTLSSNIEEMAQLMARGDKPALLRRIKQRLDVAAARWDAGGPVNEAEAAALEAELCLIELSAPATYEWKNALGDIDVASTAPSLAARIARLQGNASSLAPLSAWEFVGPFDNERGRGMTRQTSAEKAPQAGPYAGKVREVNWRLAPAPGSDGNLYIGQLLDPNEQACILARTWVQSATEQHAVLLIGATEELRVWWNGQPVYEALGLHSFGADGHACAVHLNQGWNEITLKVGGQDERPAFGARIVNSVTGAPMRLVESPTAPEGLAPVELVDPGRSLRKGTGVNGPGALAYFRRLADPASVIARGAIEAVSRRTPRKERPGYQDAKGALVAEPDSLAAAMLVLGTMRVSGALDVEEDINPWLDVLNATIEKHGPHTQLMVWYAHFTNESQGLTERALALIEEAMAADPDSILARLTQVRYLYEIGQASLAERAAVSVAADPRILAWPSQCVGLGSYLPWTNPLRGRLLNASAAAGNQGAKDELVTRAELKAGRRDTAAFLAELDEHLTESPYDVGRRVWASRRFLAAGLPEEALGLIDDAIALCPDRAALHARRGRVLLALGDSAAALTSIAKATELDPSSTDEQRLLDYLRTIDGGSGSGEPAEAEFHERFAEPLEAIVARHPADAAPDGAEDAGAVDAPREILLHRQVIEVGADGRARRYYRVVERVLSDAGVRQLDRRNFRAYRGAEDQRVLSVRVLHSDGTIDEGRTGRGAWLSIDLPPLSIGDVVDMEWRRDDLHTSIFGNYFGLDASFGPESQLATREADVTVLESPDLKLHYHLAGPQESEGASAMAVESVLDDGTIQRTWKVSDLTPKRAESLQPPASESTLRVQASTYGDWESFGLWWWSLIREEIAVSPEMQAKVAELTGDKETRAEKLRAIYDFVVTDIRYNAWEFGVHGYQPYSAPVIFSRRFGDCKDKAIVLRAMLSEVGIEAWPVLIQSDSRRSEEDHELAMVAHFNHCIAYVPEQEGIKEMFLDGTARLHPMEVLPDADCGALVLTVRSDGAEQMQIPFPAASANLLVDTIEIDLTKADVLAATRTQEPTGRWDPQLRYTFATDDAQRVEAAESSMTQFFGAIQGDVVAEHPDYEDLTTPLVLTLSAQLERVGRRTDESWELPTTFSPYHMVKGWASESERTTDLLLNVPWSVERTVTYTLPAGTTVLRVPTDLHLDTVDLGYSRTVTQSAGATGTVQMVVREHIEMRTHRVALERYEAFREAARKVDSAQRQNLAVEVPQ